MVNVLKQKQIQEAKKVSDLLCWGAEVVNFDLWFSHYRVHTCFWGAGKGVRVGWAAALEYGRNRAHKC